MEENKKINVRCRGIIVHEGKLLVVRHAPDGEHFALPGGHLEWSESVLDCIKREMFEELGIEPEIGRLLYVHSYIHDGLVQSVEFYFEIKNSADYLHTNNLNGSHAHELAEICWVGPSENKNVLPPQLLSDLNNGTLLSDTVRFL